MSLAVFRAIACAAAAVAIVSGCAGVRQKDLDAWAGKPVEALDTHPLFLTMPVYRTLTSAGVEIRNYVNSQEVAQCFASVGRAHGRGAHVSHTAFATCSENQVVCNNLFYIQAGKVVRYAPMGSCYTDDSVRP